MIKQVAVTVPKKPKVTVSGYTGDCGTTDRQSLAAMMVDHAYREFFGLA